jgi:hypothetical protein
MHRHSARLIRFAGGALVATAIAPWLGGAIAHADDLVSGDPRATAVAGNIHDQGDSTICSQLGFASDTEVGADNAAGYNAGGIEFDSDGTYLDAVSVPAGKVIDVVVVKAGDFYNRYDAPVFVTLPVNGMHGPLVGQTENVPTISHWAACIGDAPQESTPPSGSVTGNCDGVNVHLDGGTEGGSFSIDPAGTSETINRNLGHDETADVPLQTDATHPTVTLTIDGEVAGGTFTRPASCDEVESVTDPAVSFGNACASGITVTLTNMQVDDTTTDPVTFTVVSPNGKTHQVTVRADQIVRLAYKVNEDTTGTVTVTAPGLSKTTHSYAKNCTTVLGEKVVKTPKVKGEQAQLPFTGMPAGLATMIAMLMLTVGAALSVVGRRRADEGSAS